jgi:hypothetical protein
MHPGLEIVQASAGRRGEICARARLVHMGCARIASDHLQRPMEHGCREHDDGALVFEHVQIALL